MEHEESREGKLNHGMHRKGLENAIRSDGNTDRWKGSFTGTSRQKVSEVYAKICLEIRKKYKIAKLGYEIIGVARLNAIMHKIKV